ncbi:DeoR/GlpR family DNA-binding transcription regulator [Tistrella sp. BH-R2-4]|uniref:DeoR/GlpR family DNA-binding transcription regulator n=1 Tax=Tistrella arctica TaxID=3133430 RepID=A0ABU9YSE2_9PROT
MTRDADQMIRAEDDAGGTGDDDRLTPRQADILAIVRDQGFATIDALARQFDVSAQTIRREIIRLDAQKRLQRFHGGAGVIEPAVRPVYAEKQATQTSAKDSIGRCAAGLIPDGAAIFLDVGTTVEAVARALAARSGFTIVTNSLPAAMLLAAGSGGGGGASEIYVTGGSIHGPDGSLIGDTTISGLDRFRCDVAVIGFSGVDDDGALMDFDLHKVAAKQAMIRAARMVIAVGVASKFTRAAPVRIATLAQIDRIVTDTMPPRHITDAAAQAGTRIVVA